MGFYSPIIIIGMHRSGTTMVAKMLQQLGLFIGNDLEENAESQFFIDMNDWLFHQCGATWHTPQSVDWLFSDESLLKLSEEYIRIRLKGLPSIQYLGWKNFLGGMRLSDNTGTPWGWKDPRTTYTLPLWMRLFPEARIIHIYRNGVPVSESLRVRSRKALRRSTAKHERYKKRGKYNFRAKTKGFVDSARCIDLDGGFSLWEEYVSRSMEMVTRAGINSFNLKFESFLDTPVPILKKLAVFCGLSTSASRIDTIASNVVKGRAMAFLEDEDLSRYYNQVKDTRLMASLGYDTCGSSAEFEPFSHARALAM
jgi:hypothetical protein